MNILKLSWNVQTFLRVIQLLSVARFFPQDVIELVRNKTGLNKTNVESVWSVYDTLFCEVRTQLSQWQWQHHLGDAMLPETSTELCHLRSGKCWVTSGFTGEQSLGGYLEIWYCVQWNPDMLHLTTVSWWEFHKTYLNRIVYMFCF